MRYDCEYTRTYNCKIIETLEYKVWGSRMEKQIFRKKSMERITAPEELDAYIRVVNPSVWIILGAIMILLLGAFVWGSVTYLNTAISPVVVAEQGEVVMYVKDSQISMLEIGMQVELEGNTGTITELSKMPVHVDEEFSEYVMYFGDLQYGDWVYEVCLDAQIPEGIYKSRIVVESIVPISFIWN